MIKRRCETDHRCFPQRIASVEQKLQQGEEKEEPSEEEAIGTEEV